MKLEEQIRNTEDGGLLSRPLEANAHPALRLFGQLPHKAAVDTLFSASRPRNYWNAAGLS